MSRSTREGRRLEPEVGDIARGMEMRSESSPVEKSAERNEHIVGFKVVRSCQTAAASEGAEEVILSRRRRAGKKPD